MYNGNINKGRVNSMSVMTINVLLGLALATATGFRIFMPMFLLSFASHLEWMTLPNKLAWLDGDTALLVLGIAMLIELVSYLIPGLDNLMDVIDTPIAVIVGVLVVFSIVEVNSMMEWILAIVIGGVVPAVLKAFKATIRGGITLLTGGLGNGVFSIFEALASIFIVVVSVSLLL